MSLKLTLNRETLRTLSAPDAAHVAGGKGTNNTDCGTYPTTTATLPDTAVNCQKNMSIERC